MHLYEVIKHGTNSFPPGQEGTDTAYLVRAASLDEAVALVLPKLKVLADDFRAPSVDVVHVVGKEMSRGGEPMVLWGPLFQLAANRRWESWRRSSDGYHWEAYPLAEDGLAESFYQNGQKAAEIAYLNWQMHGDSVRWYENGQVMFRGRYARGKRAGVHEYWYPCGAKMERTEYRRSGVAVTKWLEDGRVLESFTENW